MCAPLILNIGGDRSIWGALQLAAGKCVPEICQNTALLRIPDAVCVKEDQQLR